MELNDLKKSWQTMDDKLQSKQFLRDDEVLNIIQKKKGNARKSQLWLVSINMIILAAALLLMAYFVMTYDVENLILGDLYWGVLLGLAIFALPWNIYTTIYLYKTNIYKMPLQTVVKRINKYNYWMTVERVAGAIFLFIFALISIVHLQLWKINGWFPYFVYGIWVVAFIGYFLIVNKITFRRLKDIRKNLDELKEVNKEN